MTAKELRLKTVDQLRAEILELMKARVSLSIQFATQQATDTSQFKKLRKDIARAKTILAEKIKEASHV